MDTPTTGINMGKKYLSLGFCVFLELNEIVKTWKTWVGTIVAHFYLTLDHQWAAERTRDYWESLRGQIFQVCLNKSVIRALNVRERTNVCMVPFSVKGDIVDANCGSGPSERCVVFFSSTAVCLFFIHLF